MSYVGCPCCGLSLTVRAVVAPRYCPRCIARFARAVALVPREAPEARRSYAASRITEQRRSGRAHG